MIVPEFWAEEKATISHDGKQLTIKRFGWSNESESDALINAKQRVNEAASRIRAGEKIRKVDHKVPYNGAEGLPIREEVVERHDDIVISRNSYGALCLNTPDVLFTDIDVEEASGAYSVALFVFFIAAAAAAGWKYDSLPVFVVGAIAAVILSPLLGRLVADNFGRRSDPYDKARLSIQAFSDKNPDWHLRLYRTPMGFRVLVMHKTFDPNGEEALQFMRALNSDPIYVRMCQNQSCFRARVSPKPWRVGMDHIRPRPGIWPVKEEWMQQRARWVETYDNASIGYAACAFEVQLGGTRADRKCERVRGLHDKFSRSDAGIDIA